MNDKLAKWKQEKEARAAVAAAKSSSSRLSSAKRTVTNQTSVPCSIKSTTSTSQTTRSTDISARTRHHSTRVSSNPSPTYLSSAQKKKQRPPVTANTQPKSRSPAAASATDTNAKLQTELAYSQYLQVRFLRESLDRAAASELSLAEDDVLRAWQQVQEAEDHVSRLHTRETDYLRKIDIYDQLQQLDVAVEKCRGSLIQTEEPLDAIIAVQKQLDRIIIIESASSSSQPLAVTPTDTDCRTPSSAHPPPIPPAMSVTKGEESLFGIYQTLANSVSNAKSVLIGPSDDLQVRHRVAQLTECRRPFEDTVSRITQRISPQLTELDLDISRLWTQLIGGGWRTEGGLPMGTTLGECAHGTSLHCDSSNNSTADIATSPVTNYVVKPLPLSAFPDSQPAATALSPSQMRNFVKNM